MKKKLKYTICKLCLGSGGSMTETCEPCGSTGKIIAVQVPETIVVGKL